MVQEGQSPRLAADGAGAEAGEPDGVVERIRIEAGDHAQALVHAVVMDELDVLTAVGLDVGVVIDTERAQDLAHRKDTAGEQPLGQIVIIC